MSELARQERMMQNRENPLVARCRAGDLDAFGQVYTANEQQVYRYAYHLLGNREEADDIKQETFVRAYQAIRKFRGDSSLQTWLLRICANLCRDKMRSWERRNIINEYRSDENLSDAVGQDPAKILERSHTTEIILRSLQHLPPSQREVIVLHDIEDLTYEEMGRILDCTAECAKVRVFRARRMLKERVSANLKMG